MYLLFSLVLAHALADYPLQNTYMALGKNPWGKERDDLKSNYARKWWHRMAAHCAIHAGLVMYFTGLWQLFVIEFIAHFIIDLFKCAKCIGSNTDQALHLLCKVIYVMVLLNL